MALARTNSNHFHIFDDLVAQDVRGHGISDDERQWLRSPEQRHNWHDALIRLLKSVDLQFTAKRMEINTKRAELDPDNPVVTVTDRDGVVLFEGSWDEYLAYVSTWRVKTNRFKNAIEERIAEVKQLRRLAVPKETIPAQAIEKILTAIKHHHDVVTEDDEDVDDVAADEELWAIIDDQDVKALAEMLGAA